jgi:hypothetical protein
LATSPNMTAYPPSFRTLNKTLIEAGCCWLCGSIMVTLIENLARRLIHVRILDLCLLKRASSLATRLGTPPERHHGGMMKNARRSSRALALEQQESGSQCHIANRWMCRCRRPQKQHSSGAAVPFSSSHFFYTSFSIHFHEMTGCIQCDELWGWTHTWRRFEQRCVTRQRNNGR